MKLVDFIKDMFTDGSGDKRNTVYFTDTCLSSVYMLNIAALAMEMSINMIASIVSKCEFKTFLGGKEAKADEYYLWNIKPNVNESSTQFMQKAISHLLRNNELLIVEQNHDLLIADSFCQEEFTLKPNKFTGVTCGDLTFDKAFYMNNVIYIKLNEKNISNYLLSVNEGYNKIMEMAVKKYKRSGGRKGKVTLNKSKSGNNIDDEALTNLFNEQFKSYFENENGVIQLSNGIEYEELSGDGSKKSTSEINDIVNLRKEIITANALALKIPPALLLGEIADVEKVTDSLLTFCIDPLIDLIESEVNAKRFDKEAYLKGNYIKIDTTCIKHVDVFSIADKLDKLISDGIYSIDELRDKLGEPPLNTWWSKLHFITKNLSKIETMEGGDIDGKDEL